MRLQQSGWAQLSSVVEARTIAWSLQILCLRMHDQPPSDACMFVLSLVANMWLCKQRDGNMEQ